MYKFNVQSAAGLGEREKLARVVRNTCRRPGLQYPFYKTKGFSSKWVSSIFVQAKQPFRISVPVRQHTGSTTSLPMKVVRARWAPGNL